MRYYLIKYYYQIRYIFYFSIIISKILKYLRLVAIANAPSLC